MYFHKTPALIRNAFPNLLWKKNTREKLLFLTFDDGPIPNVTDFVLTELKKFEAKATFFCVGENISRYPEIYSRIRKEEHYTGNHTFNHLNAFKSKYGTYLENVQKAEDTMQDIENLSDFKPQPKFFRPPYGRISSRLSKALRPKYSVVMWDVLTGDFDVKLSKYDCLSKSIKYTEAGSIITFHDSLKAENNLRFVLPRFLEHFGNQGYRFEAL